MGEEITSVIRNIPAFHSLDWFWAALFFDIFIKKKIVVLVVETI